MIKRFCDCCSNEITPENTPVNKNAEHGGVPGRLGAASSHMGRPRFEIMVCGPNEVTWNGGEWCKYCIIDAVNELDDRPQAAPSFTDRAVERATDVALAFTVPYGSAPDPCTYDADRKTKYAQHFPNGFSGTCYLDATQMRALVHKVARALVGLE